MEKHSEMINTVHPSVQKSLVFLRREFQMGSWKKGDRLFSIRMLAKKAQVSAASMCQALGTLRDEGMITLVKNRGAFFGKLELAGNELGNDVHALKEAQRWQRLQTQVEKDIFNGRFPTGEAMPSLRDLQKIYEVSYQTLRKAMIGIASTEIILPHKKTYLIPALKRAHGTLVFINALAATSKMSFGGYPVAEFLSALRRETGNTQINLVVLQIDPNRRKANFNSQLSALNEKHSVVGYIVWTSMFPEKILEYVLDTLREAHKTIPQSEGQKKPVAVIDTTWDRLVSNTLYHQADLAGWAFRIFNVAGQIAGRQIGQQLLKLGHRKVAFLSYCHKELWSQHRYRGLMQAFQAAGFGAGVHKFVIEEADDHFHALPGPSDLESFNKETVTFLNSSEKVGQNYSSSYAMELLIGAVDNYVHQLKMAARVSTILTAAEMEPKLTACVCANDRMALLAKDHFVKRNFRIPKDMSILGFDDSKAAIDNDLTSYSFSFSDIARKSLSLLLSPRQSVAESEKGSIECEGLLIERGSSGIQKI